MTVKPIQDEGQTLPPPKGKLLGIVDSTADLQQLAKALQAAGFAQVSTISGDDGLQLLERIDTFFFSDMEDRVLKRHIEEVKAGNIIAAIATPSDRVEEATRIATENGARRLVHFGAMTVTWLTK